eukprot:2619108-Alexandrium_andersonii.AAC.1
MAAHGGRRRRREPCAGHPQRLWQVGPVGQRGSRPCHDGTAVLPTDAARCVQTYGAPLAVRVACVYAAHILA